MAEMPGRAFISRLYAALSLATLPATGDAGQDGLLTQGEQGVADRLERGAIRGPGVANCWDTICSDSMLT
ncbi:MAG TPA: hypothetical protein VHO95_12600, partial [Candidatus Dormibacteraeota bacterium]|nr:hypothetical protein [Candidatus Dormibacteraeota bacterium]